MRLFSVLEGRPERRNEPPVRGRATVPARDDLEHRAEVELDEGVGLLLGERFQRAPKARAVFRGSRALGRRIAVAAGKGQGQCPYDHRPNSMAQPLTTISSPGAVVRWPSDDATVARQPSCGYKEAQTISRHVGGRRSLCHTFTGSRERRKESPRRKSNAVAKLEHSLRLGGARSGRLFWRPPVRSRGPLLVRQTPR